MSERKYNLSFGELVDKLSITGQKEIYIPEKREVYTAQINDIIHDLDLILSERKPVITGQVFRLVIILTQMNTWIWFNESNYRSGISTGNNLELTHQLNTLRTQAYSKLSQLIGDRGEYKVDTLVPDSKWIPSGL